MKTEESRRHGKILALADLIDAHLLQQLRVNDSTKFQNLYLLTLCALAVNVELFGSKRFLQLFVARAQIGDLLASRGFLQLQRCGISVKKTK